MSAIQINGFTDIHAHILPGVDDGAENMKEAAELVRMAWANGTRTMILTPHYRGVYKNNTPDYLKERFELFVRKMKIYFPNMYFYLGSEVHYQTEVPERLEQGQILRIHDTEYVLLEFSGTSPRSRIITGVTEVIRYGYVPILAHVERYDAFREDIGLADEVLELGALIQVNADSIMGKQGLRVKNFCHKLLKDEKVHFIASDAHDAVRRPPLLRDCFLYVYKKYGAEYAARVFYHNAQAVIENS